MMKIWVPIYGIYSFLFMGYVMFMAVMSSAWTHKYPVVSAIYEYGFPLSLLVVLVGCLTLLVGAVGLFLNQTWARKAIRVGIYGILLSGMLLLIILSCPVIFRAIYLDSEVALGLLVELIVFGVVILGPGLLTLRRLPRFK